MMQTILVPVLIVTGTGLIAGLFAERSLKFFAVKVDEKSNTAQRAAAGRQLWCLRLCRL